jgi:phospholipid N-methyltransferase
MNSRWQFLRRFFSDPTVVGAVAPSSRALAAELCAPFRERTKAAAVLEIGAGTGAITRQIGSLLGDRDELDICEIEPRFADILERSVLTHRDFAQPMLDGRIRLMRAPVQEIDCENRYDFIISGLPLTAFALRDVKAVFQVIRRSLKPGGVLSYFEYVGLRRTSKVLALGKQRKRVWTVSAYLSHRIRKHQYERQTVLQNFPPAYTRHLRFD